EPGGPDAVVYAILHVVTGNAGTLVAATPLHGERHDGNEKGRASRPGLHELRTAQSDAATL
ncbi:MAG: hypothetical protein NUW23_16230, partial [Firmicutes bacterium]|nr:hypothetical protein [Bacillota bacterium]